MVRRQRRNRKCMVVEYGGTRGLFPGWSVERMGRRDYFSGVDRLVQEGAQMGDGVGLAGESARECLVRGSVVRS